MRVYNYYSLLYVASMYPLALRSDIFEIQEYFVPWTFDFLKWLARNVALKVYILIGYYRAYNEKENERILNPRIASKDFEIQRFISHQVSSVANQISVVQQKLTPDHVLLRVSICSFTSLCPRFIGRHGNASFNEIIRVEISWHYRGSLYLKELSVLILFLELIKWRMVKHLCKRLKRG